MGSILRHVGGTNRDGFDYRVAAFPVGFLNRVLSASRTNRGCMELRESNPGDATRIREVVESSMTSSFKLSPQQIERIVESEFSDERLSDAIEENDAVVLVSETEADGGSNTVVGFFWGSLENERGDVRWLFVDPEHRGQDIGSRLFETGVERLREDGANELRAYALQAGMDGHQFFEQFGFEQTDERRVDLGDETLAQYVYTNDSDETGDSDDDTTTSQETGSSEVP